VIPFLSIISEILMGERLSKMPLRMVGVPKEIRIQITFNLMCLVRAVIYFDMFDYFYIL